MPAADSLYACVSFHREMDADIEITFYTNSSNAGRAFLVPYAVPFSSHLYSESVSNFPINNKHRLDLSHKGIGTYYIMVQNYTHTPIRIGYRKNHARSSGTSHILKLDGETYKYITIYF